ncbi:MAG: general secretion pathway protein L [Gammaproteobacteria bacterium]
MKQLLLKFDPAKPDDLSCLILSDDTDLASQDWISSDLDNVKNLLSDKSAKVVVVIPQHLVSQVNFDVPEKMSRQILSSIAYQIEDRLACDVEDLHCVIANSESNPVTVFVIDRLVMDYYVDYLELNNLQVECIIPELLVCPWFDNIQDVTIMQTNDGYIVRHGHFDGFKASSTTLKLMLDNLLLKKEVEILNYFCISEENYLEVKSDKVPSQYNPLFPLKPLPLSATINLQQGTYQKTSNANSLAVFWKWTLLLMVGVALVTGYNRALALFELEDELATIKQSQFELVEERRPGMLKGSASVKLELIRFLQANRQEPIETGPLDLLEKFSVVFQTSTDLEVSRMRFQNSRLTINIVSGQLGTVENLQQRLMESGLAVELDNLNIKPEAITARLTIQDENL